MRTLEYFEIVENEAALEMEALSKAIVKAKRRIHPSRLPNARKIENRRAAKARKGPVYFIKAIALGPFRKCVSCGKVQSSVTCYGCKLTSREATTSALFDPVISVVEDLGMIAPFKNNSMANSSTFTMSLLPSSYFPPDFVTYKRAPSKKTPVNLDGSLDFKAIYPAVYEREVVKLQQCTFNAVRTGRITNFQQRKIILNAPRVDSSSVMGTNDYYEREQKNLIHAFQQLGPILFKTELFIPPDCPSSVASQLHINGLDVKASIDDDKLNVDYVISSDGVDGNCSLGDFIDVDQNLMITTVHHQTHHMVRQFVRLIVQDPSSILGAEHYDATLQFPLDGSSSKAVIFSWPLKLFKLNQKITLQLPIVDRDRQELEDLIDASLTVATSVNDLKDQFSMKDDLAIEASNLCEKLQRQQFDGNQKIQQLPSMVTMVKSCTTISNANLDVVYNRIRLFVQLKLEAMHWSDLLVDTAEWLNSLQDEIQVYRDSNSLFIFISDWTDMSIPLEPEITSSMKRYSFTLFQAVYHRSLTYSTVSSLQPILRCPTLESCYVMPYHPWYLLATRLQCVTTLIGEKQKEAILDAKCKGSPEVSFLEDSPLKPLESTHTSVSILDALTRHDPTKSFILTSVRPIYVNLRRETLKFIKARSINHADHYYNNESNLWYEVYMDMYENYLDRPETVEALCLYQFSTMYKKQTLSIEGDDEDDDDEEEAEGLKMAIDTDSWCGDDSILPHGLKIKTGELYQLKGKASVMSYNVDSSNFKRVSVILFRHHRRENELLRVDNEAVDRLYYEKDAIPEALDGKELTKVETVQKALHRLFIDVSGDLYNEEGLVSFKVE